MFFIPGCVAFKFGLLEGAEEEDLLSCKNNPTFHLVLEKAFSFIQSESSREVFICAGEKNDRCMRTLETVKTAFSDHSSPTCTWTYCTVFPVYIKNKYTPMCMWLCSALF